MDKDLSQKIDGLLDIIPRGYPSMEIFYLANDRSLIVERVINLTKESGYNIDLCFTDVEISKKHNGRFLDLNSRRFNRHSKLYDFIFIELDLNSIDDLEKFIKKIYPICKNSANVLFIVDGSYDFYGLEELLSENFFVATNEISLNIEDMRVLSTKKMHGWGG
jgi:hypothetical protein